MRYTYISFLGSDDYLIGILALKNRLDVLKSEYPLTVLVSEDISNKSKRILKKYGIPYVIKKDYVPSEEIQKIIHLLGCHSGLKLLVSCIFLA